MAKADVVAKRRTCLATLKVTTTSILRSSSPKATLNTARRVKNGAFAVTGRGCRTKPNGTAASAHNTVCHPGALSALLCRDVFSCAVTCCVVFAATAMTLSACLACFVAISATPLQLTVNGMAISTARPWAVATISTPTPARRPRETNLARHRRSLTRYRRPFRCDACFDV